MLSFSGITQKKLLIIYWQTTIVVKEKFKMNVLNKKNLVKAGAIVSAAAVVSSTVFAATTSNTEDSTLSESEKVHKRMSPLMNLTIEEQVELMNARTELKLTHLNEIITILDEKGIDTTLIGETVADFENLQQFLSEVDLDETSKEELRQAFFELRPDRESAKLVRDLVKENLTEEELGELKEGFKADKEELREKYNLPERKHHSKGKMEKKFSNLTDEQKEELKSLRGEMKESRKDFVKDRKEFRQHFRESIRE